jgi:hypothetical protein
MSTLTDTLDTVGNVAGMVPGYGSLIQAGLSVGSGIIGSIQQNNAMRDLEARQRKFEEQQRNERVKMDKTNRILSGRTADITGSSDTFQMYAFGNTNIAPSQESPERIGNQTVPLSSTGEAVVGPRHEQGGVPIPGSQAEVEGGEVLDNGMVFSDRLMASETKTFADVAKELESEKANNEQTMVSTIDKYLVDTLERKNEIIDVKLAKLFEVQGKAKEQMTMQQNI